jgi:hypothetical protein
VVSLFFFFFFDFHIHIIISTNSKVEDKQMSDVVEAFIGKLIQVITFCC